MRSKLGLFPLLALGLAALACSLVPYPAGTVLFKDDFADTSGDWKNIQHSTVAEGKLVMKVADTGMLDWTNINEPDLANVHLEVTAENSGRVSDEVFGLVCGYSEYDTKSGDTTTSNADFYFLGIGTDGYYVIGKYEKSDNPKVLAKGQSDRFADPSGTYRLGADCSDGNVTLYVDGQQVATAADTSFAKGDVGLFLGTYKKANGEATFKDFVATALK